MKITIEVVGSVFRVEIDGQTVTESDGGAIAAVKGNARLADHETVEPSPSDVSDGGLNIVTKHTEIADPVPASKVSVLRPLCKHKDACGGYGFNHCHNCLRGANAEGSAA